MSYDEGLEQQELPSEMEAHRRGISHIELAAEMGIDLEDHFFLGAYERRLIIFTRARIREAQFADAWHMLPGNLPIDEQPWWKMAVWQRYLAGFSDHFGKG